MASKSRSQALSAERIASESRQAQVTVSNIWAGYRTGSPVLHDVSIDIEPSETVSLLGPSGCGKTTLLRTIAGLQRPFSGEIRIADQLVDGTDVHVEPHHRRVGMVFQDGALFPHLTVAENVAFGLRGMDNPGERAAELLALVELSDFADRLPDTLSGGQRQRVALARALAPNPSVLLLDEPFSALDAGMRNQIRRDVKRILQQIGITTIVVTHDQDEAFVFGDRVALMREGELAQVGPSTELYDRPKDRWVADFVGEVNVVDGVLVNKPGIASDTTPYAVETMFGVLPAVVVDAGDAHFAAKPVDVLIRPEQFDITSVDITATADETSPDVSERATVVGHVESAEYFGHDVLYQLTSERGPLVVRSIDSSFSPGDQAVVRFSGRSVVAWSETAPATDLIS